MLILFATLLDVLTFNSTLAYNLAGFIGLVVALVGSFFKLQNDMNVLKNENTNLKENVIRLEDRLNNSESKTQSQLSMLDEKMESRFEQVYDKIERLPQDLSVLFKNILSKN